MVGTPVALHRRGPRVTRRNPTPNNLATKRLRREPPRRERMQPSMFNVQVPLPERNEVFLMNTFSDAQLLVSPDVPALLERLNRGDAAFTVEERETLGTLAENGFIVKSYEAERDGLREYFRRFREDTEQMK